MNDELNGKSHLTPKYVSDAILRGKYSPCVPYEQVTVKALKNREYMLLLRRNARLADTKFSLKIYRTFNVYLLVL